MQIAVKNFYQNLITAYTAAPSVEKQLLIKNYQKIITKKNVTKVKQEFVKQKHARQYYLNIIKKTYAKVVREKDMLNDLLAGAGKRKKSEMAWNDFKKYRQK